MVGLRTTEPLTSDAILDAAEGVIRRFGPAKASVVDVARALGVSHGSVYRHFASKAALRDAVTQRWLHRVSAPLEEVVAAPGPAPERLRRWLLLLAGSKQRMAREDPELFETFQQLTWQSRDVVAAHVDQLAEQLGRILAQGVSSGHLASDDPRRDGRAVLHATARFHHPALAGEWTRVPGARLERDLEAVYGLLLTGLAPR